MTLKKATMKKIGLALFTGLTISGAALVGTAAQAGQVALTSLDGKVTLTGEIVGVEGFDYLIANNAGTYKITSYLVTCTGYSCPEEKGALIDLEYTSGLADTVLPQSDE